MNVRKQEIEPVTTEDLQKEISDWAKQSKNSERELRIHIIFYHLRFFFLLTYYLSLVLFLCFTGALPETALGVDRMAQGVGRAKRRTR